MRRFAFNTVHGASLRCHHKLWKLQSFRLFDKIPFEIYTIQFVLPPYCSILHFFSTRQTVTTSATAYNPFLDSFILYVVSSRSLTSNVQGYDMDRSKVPVRRSPVKHKSLTSYQTQHRSSLVRYSSVVQEQGSSSALSAASSTRREIDENALLSHPSLADKSPAPPPSLSALMSGSVNSS